MYSVDIEELKAKHICAQCVGEEFLSSEIELLGTLVLCSYCGETGKAITVEELADRTESAFEDHYTRTPDQPNAWEQNQESDYGWQRDGTPVAAAIKEAAELPAGAAGDVLAILSRRHFDFEAGKIGEESEFSSGTSYEEKGASAHAWQAEWHTFEQSLKTETRFFSRSAAAHLGAIFGGIDALKTTDGRPLVVQVGPQVALHHLFRARVFQSRAKLKEALCRPDIHLGSPPTSVASAGRMNARGISVFYGATEKSTAIAEVRPPVGSNVAAAKFLITRPLRLLDLTALEDVKDGGSIFDSTLKDRLERVSFLRTLGQLMTRPVMPDDETFDYLPTQAIADFLATANEPQLDGILFPSVQVKAGRNVVLFHKAARAEGMNIPEGTDVVAYCTQGSEDEPEIDYRVSEAVPPVKPLPPKDDGLSAVFSYERDRDDDSRVPTLRVDPNTVEVHHVDWAEYNCTTQSVPRYRFDKHAMFPPEGGGGGLAIDTSALSDLL